MTNNADIPYLLWECPVRTRDGEHWHYILELYKVPDDHTLLELKNSQFMYGWLDVRIGDRSSGEPSGLVCWHARHGADVEKQLALHGWTVELLGKAVWS